MYKILLVVDMQNDFVTGSLGTPEARVIVSEVSRIIENLDYDQIIYTMDTHYEDYFDTQEGKLLPVEHCKFNTEGWRLVGEMADSKNCFHTTVVRKSTFGVADIGNYTLYDSAPSEITIVGLCTDICVISNALILKSKYPEAKIRIIANATAGTTPAAKEAALTVARSCLIEVVEDISEVVKND